MAPRVLVFGTGAIGAVAAYILSRSIPAENIVTVCRSNYEVASQDGFRLNSTIWGKDLVFRPKVVRSVEEAAALEASKPFDYILVSTKILPSETPTAQALKPAISNSTAIVLMQNGIVIEGDYAQLYPDNPLLSVVVYLPVTQVKPAVFEHVHLELLHVGTYPAQAPSSHKTAARSFVQLIEQGGATVRLHDDVQPERWSKLLINGTLNPICALSRSRTALFLRSGDAAPALFRDVMNEIASVAQALGYTSVNQESVDYQYKRHMSYEPPGVEPSTMADALAGRRMEVDALVGNIVKLANEKSVTVPILRTLYVLLTALDNSLSPDGANSQRGPDHSPESIRAYIKNAPQSMIST